MKRDRTSSSTHNNAEEGVETAQLFVRTLTGTTADMTRFVVVSDSR